MFDRIKRLWKLSEPPKPRQWTWNGEPVSKEILDERMSVFPKKAVSLDRATFIPRITKDPAKEITEEPSQ